MKHKWIFPIFILFACFIFHPVFGQAAELPDSDESIAKWDEVEITEGKMDGLGEYTFFKFPEEKYNSEDSCKKNIAKYAIDLTADRKADYFKAVVPFQINTEEDITEDDLTSQIEEEIKNLILYGNNVTKKEILSFSWGYTKENLSDFDVFVTIFNQTETGYSGKISISVKYRYNQEFFNTYETKMKELISSMELSGKDEYATAFAVTAKVRRAVGYDLSSGNQSGIYALVDGKGVCAGISSLCVYAGRCAGLDVLYEFSDAVSDHAWVIMKVDGDWYYTDVTNCLIDKTWDKPYPTKFGDPIPEYYRFDFLQGNDWLKCEIHAVDPKFEDWIEKYHISDHSYNLNHSECEEHKWSEFKGISSPADSIGHSTCVIPYRKIYYCINCKGSKYEYLEAPIGHDYIFDEVIEEATCVFPEQTRYVCSRYNSDPAKDKCYSYPYKIEETAPPLGHDYKEEITKEATCSEKGIKTYTCTRCGDSYTEEIGLTPHQHTEIRDAVAASCDKEGYSGDTYCLDCGKKIETGKATSKTEDHIWGEGTVIKEPTCIHPGTTSYTCTRCGATKNEYPPYLDHDWKEEVTEPTCSMCGIIKKTCNRCGETETSYFGSVLGHDMQSTKKEPTCTESGEVLEKCSRCGLERKETLEPLGHNWKENEDGTATCTRCGEKHTHNWKWYWNTVPTCTEDGEKVWTCSDCGQTKTETVKAEHTWVSGKLSSGKTVCYCTECKITKNHDFVEDPERTQPATCTTAETHYGECSRCGQKLKKIIGSPLGHDWKDNGDGTATCTRCEEKHTHAWDDGVVTKEATCKEDGIKTYTCTVCKDTKEEAIKAIGHPHTEVRDRKEATCKEDGYTGDTWCTDCNTKIKEGSVIKADASLHQWNKGEITTPATCEKEGTKTYTCTVCGDTKEEAIKAIGHREEVRNKKEAGCEEDGYTGDTYCKTCGEKISAGKKIPAGGHSWNKGVVTKKATYDTEGVKTYTCEKCKKTRTERIPKLKRPSVFSVSGNKYKVVKGGIALIKAKSAKKANIPSTVKAYGLTYKIVSIEKKAFTGSKFSSVTIGSNITSIKKDAFYKCKNLKTITIKTTKLKEASKKSFKGIHKKAVLKVPKKSKKAYSKMFKGLKVK